MIIKYICMVIITLEIVLSIYLIYICIGHIKFIREVKRVLNKKY